MSFVYPAFLSALAFLAIPIIIHLFNFKKYKRLYFPDIRFLKEVKEKTKRQSQLKHLIVLCCRMLVFALLVFAFAQPFTGNKESASPNKIISIYIDNSFSTQALGKNGPLLDVAKQKAIEIIKSSSQSTRFQILTNEMSSISQRLFSKESALEQIELIQVSPIARSAAEILSRQEESIKANNESASIKFIHISDFQKNSFNYPTSQTTHSLTLIPLVVQEQSNISIDSVWFNTPLHALNSTEEFYFRIKNHSTSSQETATLQLFLNDRQKSVATITIPAGASVDSSFSYTNNESGIIQGKLNINDKQVVFDDQFYFSYRIEPFLEVACINAFPNPQDTASYNIKSIFTNDGYYKFRSFTKHNLDFSILKQQQLIILNQLEEISSGLSQEIEKFVASGGSVCIIPSLKINLGSYNNFNEIVGLPFYQLLDTNRTISEKPDFKDPFFNGIFEKQPSQLDVPLIRKHYGISTSTKSLTNTILKLKDGSDLISLTKYKKGKLYQFSSSTDEKAGNLGQHALFVPIILRMAELSINSIKPYSTFGKDAGFEIKPTNIGNDQVFSLVKTDTKESIIPEFKNEGNSISVFYNSNIKTSGNYNLVYNEKIIAGTSLNYPRTESVLAYYNSTSLSEMLKSNGYKNFNIYSKPVDEGKIEASAIDTTKKYWTSCIWFALLFLFTESLLLKFWKTN